ncbi:glycosyltransferase family 4 protein [Pontibacter sp. H259]|uniref:glycosyltransferase family 4 protein n=1 Tax=Pontibacter sp. H259 TaxID=3133421 RepID=UPI0030BA4BFB
METHHPSKILMTADTLGGIWTYALELVKALSAAGTQVALALTGNPLTEEQRQAASEIKNLTIYESNYKPEWMDSNLDDVARTGEWLLQLRDEVEPDLVHLNSLVHASLPWNKPVIVVAHSCVVSWWQAVKNYNAPKTWDKYKEFVTKGLQAADMVVTTTQAMMHMVAETYGPFKQSNVVYNGRGQQHFRFGKKEPFVFTMGSIWDEGKNISILAHIASDLAWPVYVAGDNTHPETGQSIELENVHFLGSLTNNEIADWLSRASIFALPARYEPFGLAVLEAAMSGCALLVGKIETMAEIWGNAAKYVDPNNADDVRDTLQSLIEDEFCRNIMACRAVKRSHGYTAEQMAQDYTYLYSKLIRNEVPVY